jgi:WD40 repeat protein
VVEAEAGGRLRVWDVNKGAESTSFVAAPGPFGAWFTDNGKFLVTKYGPDTNMVLEAWDTDNWKRKSSVAVHLEDFWDIYTPALPNCCVIRGDGGLRLVDVTKLSEAPKLIKTKTKTLGGNFWATSPDGRFGAIPDGDGFVTLWDIERLQPLETLSAFRIASNVAAFSPDGRRLVAGSRGSEAVKLWDVETRQELLTLSGEGVIASLKFSPDGRCLLGINTAGVAQLWFAPTLAEIDAAEKAVAATGN